MGARRKRDRRGKEQKPMLFSALNYRLMGVGVLLIVAGFTGMYLEMEVYGFISLYLAPIVILAGYILIIFAILKGENRRPDRSTSA